MNKTIRNTIKINIVLVMMLIATIGIAEKYDNDNELKDAWIDGKLETALMFNRHLNNFTIDTEVKKQTAYLSGKVESDVDKELAEEIAKGIKGVKDVENNLVVSEKYERRKSQYNQDDGRTFTTWYDDVTTTAAVKSKLLWNGSVEGLSINVDTLHGVVTLNGDVESSSQKSLIQKLTENTDGVRDIKNKLKIVK